MTLLADLLEQHDERLLQRWVMRLQEDVAAGDESESELRDHVPQLLRELRAALRSEQVRPDNLMAQVHGRQRYRIGFAIESVVREYGFLRDCIFDLIEELGASCSFTELRTLTGFLSNAIAEGVREHGRQKHQADLAAAAELERARDEERDKLLASESAARSAAQQEREKLHGLFMQAPVAVAILEGADHRFTFANPNYRALVNDRDVVGKPLLEALPDIEGMGFDRLMDQVMSTGESIVAKAMPIKLAHHRDDETLLLDFVYTARRNSEGERDGVLMTGWDVTELVVARQRVEALAEKMRTSEAQWRLLTDALPVLVSFVGADQRYRLVNKAYEDWFGQSREQLTGRTVRDVIGDAAYAVMRPNIERGLAGEHFSYEQVGVPYRVAGPRDVRVTFVPQRTSSGAVDGYVALIQDITESRRLHQERATLSGQMSEVLESMADAFFALDRSFRIVLVNEKYEQLVRKTRQQMLGRVYWELFPEAHQPGSQHYQAYQRAVSERAQVHFVEYDGTLDQWTDVRVFPTADGGISVFLRDVTVERRAEEALRRAAEFEQQLIGIVSHDLRTPLNVIMLASGRMTRGGEVNESVAKNTVRIRNAAERAIAMVGDLLDFTQARLGGGISIDPRPCDLNAVIERVLEDVEATFPGRKLVLQRAEDGRGQWDPERLAQVVQNLVTNALKYSPPDSLVHLSTHGDSDALSLVVHNGGLAIAPDKLDTLFQPFQRAGQLDKTSRSVGLGLYIVNQIVTAHRGTLEVQSDDAHGTTFTVTLPRGALAES